MTRLAGWYAAQPAAYMRYWDGRSWTDSLIPIPDSGIPLPPDHQAPASDGHQAIPDRLIDGYGLAILWIGIPLLIVLVVLLTYAELAFGGE